jgi:hypothetical protein
VSVKIRLVEPDVDRKRLYRLAVLARHQGTGQSLVLSAYSDMTLSTARNFLDAEIISLDLTEDRPV